MCLHGVDEGLCACLVHAEIISLYPPTREPNPFCLALAKAVIPCGRNCSSYPIAQLGRGWPLDGFVSGQVVGDCEPRCLGADEDVLGRADSRIVDESSHGDVDKLAVADDRVEERAAR
jgi:hypothetical protein